MTREAPATPEATARPARAARPDGTSMAYDTPLPLLTNDGGS
ncbi:hypothetical protein [Streptomyces sp. NPDC047061]